MYRKNTLLAASAAVVLALFVVAGGVFAADHEKKEHAKKGVAIGQAMPDFTLKDLDGKEHSLSQHKGNPVVLVFVSNGCPWSRGADPQLSELAKAYQEKGVVVLGIDSDKNNTPEQIKAYVTEKNVGYPILKDEGNKVADLLGAKQTPEVFLVDKDGKLVYHGAVDDRKAETEAGKTNYIQAALDETLQGKPVSTPEKKQWGCGIKRVEKG
ncbi:MAG: thioredoxin family protein [FCB group bacterium]|nr:thioredoxin family protein [FCB group bacterium]